MDKDSKVMSQEEQTQKEQQEQIKDVKQKAAILVTKQCGVTQTTSECLC